MTCCQNTLGSYYAREIAHDRVFRTRLEFKDRANGLFCSQLLLEAFNNLKYPEAELNKHRTMYFKYFSIVQSVCALILSESFE